jgi:hypothetical protein
MLIVPSLSICEDVNGDYCKCLDGSVDMLVFVLVFCVFSGLVYVFIFVRHNSSELCTVHDILFR